MVVSLIELEVHLFTVHLKNNMRLYFFYTFVFKGIITNKKENEKRYNLAYQLQ